MAGYQRDYAGGFVTGFVEYVRLGGYGEPPPVPPREYWEIAIRASDGTERAAQWFEGYRHGTRVAMDGGYRELATLESSLMASVFDGPASEPAMEVDSHSMGGDGLPPFEELPMPSVDSPFQDDVPNGTPTEGTQSQPATSDSAVAPAMDLDDADRSNNSVTWRRAPVESSKLPVKDSLIVEDITAHARAKARRSLIRVPKGVKSQSTLSRINRSTRSGGENEDAPWASSTSTTPVIRIVGAGRDESTTDTGRQSQVSE
jgi:hypothetical protein